MGNLSQRLERLENRQKEENLSIEIILYDENEDIQDKLNTIINDSMVSLIRVETIKSSWELRAKYNISFWDSLIVASALENKCTILYTEDLHHSQLIEGRLRILNPLI